MDILTRCLAIFLVHQVIGRPQVKLERNNKKQERLQNFSAIGPHTNPKYNHTYETIQAHVSEQLTPASTTKYFVYDSGKNEYYSYESMKVYGHWTVIANPLRTFSVLEPHSAGGCSKKIIKSVRKSAKQRECLNAQNAGFFNIKSRTCFGNVISDGRLVQNYGNIQHPSLGITKNGTIVVGYLSKEEIEEFHFQQLIGGVIWLVRNGKPYVDEAHKCESPEIQETGTLKDFIDVKSARTAIGHDVFGRLVVIAVEGKTGMRGVDLHRFSRILINEFQLENAINLDGGTSATLVLNGTVSNYPNGYCEPKHEKMTGRVVATIICVHSPDCVSTCVHGECVDGRCSCYANYKGDTCNVNLLRT